MRSVRVFYEKRGRMKFVSHLDMNRFFIRVIRKSGLNVWYTEGFNPHPYITFALPLSLGFESAYEILEFRVLDDDITNEQITNALSVVVPEDIKILYTLDAVNKVGKIGFARYELGFENSALADAFKKFITSGNVVINKKTKKGEIKVLDVSDKITLCDDDCEGENNTVTVMVTAGNDNLNPQSVVEAFFENDKEKALKVSYLRTMIYTEKNEKFV